MKWPPTPPFPACLAFQTTLGYPNFSHFTGPWASIAPCWLLQGIPGHWKLSPVPPPRSLPVLTSVSHRPSPTPLCSLGVLSLQKSQSTTPEGFELPGAQGSDQRPEGPTSGPAAHAIWVFSHVEPEAHTSPGNPPAQVPWDTRQRGQCLPYRWEGGSIKPRKEAWTF